jgi:hypothetical protein
MQHNSESVRILDWLAARTPPAPPALSAIIAGHVGSGECLRTDLPGQLIDCAVRILEELGHGRDSANDLLAADALVTYAIEAAAEECGNLEAFSLSTARLLAQSGTLR